MPSPVLRQQDMETLRHTFRRFPCVREVRVFGSRATGRNRRASDIDLAISAPEADAADWLELAEALAEVPIIYELDLVRSEWNDNSRLLEKIAVEGVSIYPEPNTSPLH